MFSSSSKTEELVKRVLFTLIALGIYRLGTQVPTPGIDEAALASFFDKFGDGSIIGILNTFTGGALQRLSILALGVMPYITSSIIMTFLMMSYPGLAKMQEDPSESKKINQWIRYGTLPICVVQGLTLALTLENQGLQEGVSIVMDPGWGFRLMTICSLTGGTMFLMWLGEQVSERGVGNGISLIIAAGIAANIPGAISSTYDLFMNGEISILSIALILAILFAAVWFITLMEVSYRKVPLQIPKKSVKGGVQQAQTNFLPIKINNVNVMPPIVAYVLLGFPVQIAGMIDEQNPLRRFFDTISQAFSQNGFLPNLFVVILIVYFSYSILPFYLKPEKRAEDLRKRGVYIPGLRPGGATKNFHSLCR